VLAKYLKPDLLLIDDMGIKQLPSRSGEYLFEIIMRRYELKSPMTTSNRPLEDFRRHENAAEDPFVEVGKPPPVVGDDIGVDEAC
jgi:DNA replication protein DnaC